MFFFAFNFEFVYQSLVVPDFMLIFPQILEAKMFKIKIQAPSQRNQEATYRGAKRKTDPGDAL